MESTVIAPSWATSDLQVLLERQRKYFASGATKSPDFRIQKLKQLKKALEQYEPLFFKALQQDFQKAELETYITEIALIYTEIKIMLRHLKEWSKPQRVSGSLFSFPSANYMYPEPYGTVLVMGAWNYPLYLSIAPTIGAIAAGNTVILKPSELSPQASKIMFELIKEVFEPEHYAVVEGGVEVAQDLLKAKFDKIFYTGSTQVGKLVMKAAAEHLTPVTLEMGGKSPCIVDQEIEVDLAAKRIVWGKFVNAGQTCIAPDYLVVHAKVKAPFIKAMNKYITEFYGADPKQSPDYARIINQKHFERLKGYLSDGEVIVGGETDFTQNYIAPTLLDHVSWDSHVMQEEIFGPILPILTFENLDEVLQKINSKPKPLSFYYFGKKASKIEKVIQESSFGGGCINETLMHLANHNMPFGGVGASGMGGYHGKFSFDTFTHYKSVLKKPFWLDFPFRYPPYQGKMKLMRQLTKWL